MSRLGIEVNLRTAVIKPGGEAQPDIQAMVIHAEAKELHKQPEREDGPPIAPGTKGGGGGDEDPQHGKKGSQITWPPGEVAFEVSQLADKGREPGTGRQ